MGLAEHFDAAAQVPLRGVSNLLDLRDIRRRGNLADDSDRPINFLDVGGATVVVSARVSDRVDHSMGFKQRDYSNLSGITRATRWVSVNIIVALYQVFL